MDVGAKSPWSIICADRQVVALTLIANRTGPTALLIAAISATSTTRTTAPSDPRDCEITIAEQTVADCGA